ncbi:MAG: hypothetical protein M3394_04080 [Actinomycetota bacterium]|nr:hypothetical protein [Actinomycetota bacterium]
MPRASMTRRGHSASRVGLAVLSAAGAGIGFGLLTSLCNAASSPYLPIGNDAERAGLDGVATFASLVLGAGWAWAALAVAVATRSGRRLLGGGLGLAALLGASSSYYVGDVVYRGEALSSYTGDMRYWVAASLLFGPALGVIGASAKGLE